MQDFWDDIAQHDFPRRHIQQAHSDDAVRWHLSDKKIVGGMQNPLGHSLHGLVGAPPRQERLIVAVIFGTNFAHGTDQDLVGVCRILTSGAAYDRCRYLVCIFVHHCCPATAMT